MSLLGIFSGDKKSQTSNVSTQTTNTDSSKNVGGGALLLESGASITNNDLSESVARDALAGMSSVANNSVASAAILADNSIGRSFDFGEAALAKIAQSSSNTTAAAQDSISYANRLAEIGLNAKSSADTGGATATIDAAGKYLVAGLFIAALAYYLRRK